MSAREGCGSISDRTGQLLFYTNGVSVWDRKHQVMPNGEDLNGDISATQSVIIVPRPLSDTLFYIFTVDKEGGKKGIQFSVVNMRERNGFGDVTEKNNKLFSPVAEKLTAVKHKNNIDIWVMTHAWNSDSFLVYQVTPEGINQSPVISETGLSHSINSGPDDALGCIKASPYGDKLAVVKSGQRTCELFDFDNSTGYITNPVILYAFYEFPYGIEFSPDGNKLYVSSFYEIFQFDLTKIVDETIYRESEIIGTIDGEYFSTMQLAPDGKIYITSHPPHNAPEYPAGEYLHVIHYPNAQPEQCGFEKDAIFLNGRGAQLGLPAFIQTYLKQPPFYTRNFCYQDTTYFRNNYQFNIASITWHFDDSLSTKNNTSTETNPTHIFSQPGEYQIQRILKRKGFEPDTGYRTISIHPLPRLNLGKDTILCGIDSLVLTAADTTKPGNSGLTHVWQDSVKGRNQFTAHHTGLYTVRATNKFGCSAGPDSIFVTLGIIPEFELGEDLELCDNETAEIGASGKNWQYQWNTGDTVSHLDVNSAGKYALRVIDSNGCTYRDSIFVYYDFTPDIHLPGDTSLCNGDDMYLSVTSGYPVYEWNTGSPDNRIYIDSAGIYSVTVSNRCGTVSDAIRVDYRFCGELYIPNVLLREKHVFEIRGIGPDEKWILEIYNRWGRLVFSTTNYTNNLKASTLAPGVYYYYFSNVELKVNKTGFFHVF